MHDVISQNLYESSIVPSLTGSMDNIILFFKEERILKSEIICEECGKPLRWTKNLKLMMVIYGSALKSCA